MYMGYFIGLIEILLEECFPKFFDSYQQGFISHYVPYCEPITDEIILFETDDVIEMIR